MKILNLPHCCHGNYCPPECIRDTSELAIFVVLFRVKNCTREQHNSNQEEKDEHGQFSWAWPQRVAKDL